MMSTVERRRRSDREAIADEWSVRRDFLWLCLMGSAGTYDASVDELAVDGAHESSSSELPRHDGRKRVVQLSSERKGIEKSQSLRNSRWGNDGERVNDDTGQSR